MSLLMEALKKAEAAKLAVTPPPASMIEKKPAIIEEELESVEEELEEIRDEVNAWQQQLLAETSDRAAFILEESQENPSDITIDDESPLVEMLVAEKPKEIDWEAGILPEFQAILATEPISEPIVLEDNHSNLHLEEEPSVDFESAPIETTSPAPTLSFSREIEPDLSLDELHRETPSSLKLDWDDEIAVESPSPPPVTSRFASPPQHTGDNLTEPSPTVGENIASVNLSREQQAAMQRQEIKRLFKASARTSSYRWAYLVMVLVIFVGIIGLYGLQNEALLTHYISLLNNQFIGEPLVNVQPPSNPIPTHPVELATIQPAQTPPPLPTPPQNGMDASPKPVAPVIAKPVETQPIELATKSAVPIPDKHSAPKIPPEPTKVAIQPRSSRSKPTVPENAMAMVQVPKSAAIQITRSAIKPRLHQNLTQAYTAFQRGENNHALTAYQTVLQQEPRNRDALLGVAAIAVRQGNHPQARRYYQEVLKYYPKDPVAQTNLLSISEQANHEDRETQLKTLTRTTQQPAYVYFQLGLVYAQQNRWNDAQQAFFEAYRIDSQQADYAYNLAVSLEYLHQPQAAVTYYQRAIQLQQKQGKSRSFEPHVVQQRIATLLKTTTSRREVANLLDNIE